MPTPPSPRDLLQIDDPRAAASSTPLVLLHGFPLDRRIFAPMLPHLPADMRVVACDLPGFGQSPALADAFSLEDLARTVRAFLQARGLLPCVLGGLSMGGYVALAYHRLFAADLRGLVLIDTKSTADTAEAKANRDRMADIALREGSSAIARLMQPKMLSDTTRRELPGVEPTLMEIMQACPPTTIAAALIAMRDRPDYTPDLARTTVPLLMITGADDAIAPPEVGKAVAAACPPGLGTYVEIPHAGHIATMERPKDTAAAISGWMSARLL